jgi:hypothetical protein
MKQHHHIAVWAMVIAHQILGFLWYSPWLFLPLRASSMGKTLEQANVQDPVAIVSDIVTTILAAYTISWLVQKLEMNTLAKGAMLGLILFAGIILQAIVPHYKFLLIPDAVLLMDLGLPLLWTVLTASVLAVWRK